MDELNHSDEDQNAKTIVLHLFHHRRNEMLAFAFSMVKDKEEAKDIVFEALYRVSQSKQVFENLVNAENYFFIIVKHHCLEVLEKRKNVRKKHRQYLEDNAEPVVTYEDIEKLTHRNLLVIREWLDKQLLKLQPAAARIVKSGFLEEKKNKQIASEMNISEDTVATQKSKGLTQLRKNNPDLPEELIPLILLSIVMYV